MRQNRGCKWKNSQMNRPNNRGFRTYRNTTNQNISYIGHCRCGYGPNAFYKIPHGNIVHVSQLPSFPSGQTPQKTNIIENSQSYSSAPIEIYRICDSCGARIRDDAYFCTECGNAVGTPFGMTKKEQIDTIKERIRELKNEIKAIKKSNI